ncbi:MAG: DUF4157 domain-containing protein [Balneolaceae bacterium]
MFTPLQKPKTSDSGPARNPIRPLIQPELEVGRPGDKYEQEADEVARRVMMQPETEEEEAVRMQPAEEKEEALQMQAMDEEEEALQMQPAEDEDEMMQMQPAEEEDEALQMQAVEDEEESVRMQTGDEEEILQAQVEEEEGEEVVQAQAEEEEEMLQMQAMDEEDEVVQTQPALRMAASKNGGAGKASPGLANRVAATKGTGSPLNPGTRGEMGNKMGSDFSGVNIHTGHQASQMNQELGAKAFTVGSDIYFNRGQYNPHSSEGKRLLAHELTHTVQQGGAAQKKIQREDENDEEDTTSASVAGTLETGRVDANSNTITFENLSIPSFKGRDHRGDLYRGWNLKRSKGYNSSTRPSNQQQIWKNNINTSQLVSQLRQKAEEEQFQPDGENYVFITPARPITSGEGSRHRPRGQSHFHIGTLEEIAKAISAPSWNRRGSRTASMEVDHIVELQISGYPDEEGAQAHTISNMELLERRPNQMSGTHISRAINNNLNSILRNNDTKQLIEEEVPEIENASRVDTKRNIVKRNFDLVFNSHDPSGGPSINENSYWQREDIEAGEHIDQVEVGDFSQLGEPGRLLIFPTTSGGVGKTFEWDGSSTTPSRGNKEHDWLKPFEIIEKRFYVGDGTGEENEDLFGELDIQIPENKRDTYKEMSDTVSIDRIPGADFAGRLKKYSIKRSAEKIEVKKASPVTVEYFEVNQDQGIIMGGKVLPTIPFISEAQLEYSLQGDDLSVFKTFDIGELNTPPPFTIDRSSLTLEISTTRGIVISGRVDFGINQVGEGYIGAASSTSGGFELEGTFNFDSELFQPAEIEVEYKDEVWTIGGHIGIPEGKIRGVKSADIEASYSEGNFEASGEAELDIPGIERGTMNVQYGEEGFSVGGAFDLSSDIPGIRGGDVEATISKEGEEDYSVSVFGTAEPDIPGVDTTLSVNYEDGAITIAGTADYSRGMLSGNVQLGATNRPIDDEGQPEGEPDETMRVYGGGSLTLELTPWLAATAGVNFLPNGEMEVMGRIGLPDTVEVFPRKQMDRNLFTAPTLEIPLFAIPLGPRSIGLVAQIGGRLDFSAGFGPGELRELSAEVTYNPDREEETTLHGEGLFAIPADAGLTLRADVGLGVSVGVASLTGGIELAGTLGLEGEASASVDVDWTPQTGIELDAEGRVTVNPKFEFDVNAFARASLGVGFLSISETWRHNLAGFEWGPDIQFGVVFPIHYKEDEPFDVSFEDIEVIYPELEIPDMAKGLAADIKDDIFD